MLYRNVLFLGLFLVVQKELPGTQTLVLSQSLYRHRHPQQHHHPHDHPFLPSFHSTSSSPHHLSHRRHQQSFPYHQQLHSYPDALSSSSTPVHFPASLAGFAGSGDPILSARLSAPPTGPSSTPTVVRHPGTCTLQRSQPACTFSLLCYMAGGLPIEGCEGDPGLTCCLLYGGGVPSLPSSLDQQVNQPPLPFTQMLRSPPQVTGGAPPQQQPALTRVPYHPQPEAQSHGSSYQSFPVSYQQSYPPAVYPDTSSNSGTPHHQPDVGSLSPAVSSSSGVAGYPFTDAMGREALHVPRLPPAAHHQQQEAQSYRHHYPELQPPPVAPVIPQSSSRYPALPIPVQSPRHTTPSTTTTAASSSSVKSVREAKATQILPHAVTQSSYLPQSAPSSVLPSHVAIDDVGDNTVRRTIGSFDPAISNAVDFVQRNQHSRDFSGDDVCGKPTAKPRSRIIGGQDAFFGEFPWQVHIKIAKHQCGGALVNREFVVTAAHCVYQAPLQQLSIVIGAYDIEDQRFQDEPAQFFSVAEVRLHPNFRFSASHPDRYDVAVLKLDKAAHYSDNVLPVCLPPKSVSFEGWYGVVTGWGKTDPALSNRYGTRLLQKVDVPIIKNHECESWHHTRGIDLKIFPEMFCAGYEDGRKDACVGDSGGPLVVFLNNRWTLAGITSAGFGCAQSRQPGIYHRLPVTVDWVRENIVS